jgi:beta-glucuronidase
MRTLRPALLSLLALAAVAATAPAAVAADGLTTKTESRYGPDGRYLMGGQWLFKLDSQKAGLKENWQRQTSKAGWSPVTVPNAWNATDQSSASMGGGVGWYRKDFRLPSSASRFSWVLRFESVNYRARIWLNGKPIGRNTGAYLPFEVRIPSSALKRGGMNRLVVRVDSVRHPFDFPPSGLTTNNEPTGGWWNYGGLLREVYLRRVDRVDFTAVQVRPELACATCSATVTVRVTVRNFSDRAQRLRIAGRFGSRNLRLGTKAVGPGRFATYTDRFRLARPRLWEPGSPNLYNVRLTGQVGGSKVAGWFLRSGVRSIKVRGGHLLLNGKRLNIRGMGLHEDDPKTGLAIDRARRTQIVDQVQEVGATMMRSHYPFHPHIQELADERGILVWSEIPVYAVKTKWLKRLETRKLAAKELAANIVANQAHPSTIVWSIGNELSARPGPVQADYIRRAAQQAKALDPTRPVGYAVAGYPTAGCQKAYDPLDVIGVNDYFGWYPGPNGVIADRDALSDYLDSVRACYPNKAIMATEFGAEANRSGPVEEKGTYEFQQDYINYHYGVYATKPWLSGALYWALKEFRVRPEWEGGNPRPEPPIHQKGVVAFDGTRKPAFADLQRIFRATNQYRAR